MSKKNLIYGQSGGVTSVINASAYGAIVAALNNPEIEKVYAGKNGISGILREEFFDLGKEPRDEIARIPYTPGAIFGSCRKKLKTEEEFKRLFEIFDAHNIGYFLYNGGNDSMETVHQIAIKAKELGYDLKAIGIPKTVDNDLMHTDHCPGYGSAAKFTAISILEATRDLESMHTDSTQVFILESMGRYAGWLAASGALANMNGEHGPQIFLLPEVPFDEKKFLSKVEEVIARDGYCSIVAAEALKDSKGNYISTEDYLDAFGNVQLGKIGIYLQKLIRQHLGRKVHTALPDYLQRSSRHVASLTDWQEAIEVGAAAVKFATRDGLTDIMVSIVRDNDYPYLRHYEPVELSGVASAVKYLLKEFISKDGFGVTTEFVEYAKPLIEGEAPVNYMRGIPLYAGLKKVPIEKKLKG
ncbi:6-phosphofructokinase [Kosmotoga arenicorallina S304]|uniref:Pyrophosphate--fructose 6-phosphate 1-phosphotransferase n=1 Tax=Kosmotoga arenicorallina S304 TaxID=1453497 RepID=A0A176K1T6_9BACT|nr:6-phosphofructokinase [Kosmotoga arenicorallina]OAA31108.1 6-phosphofructokinase [Kosmotoga arenicorallina S304]